MTDAKDLTVIMPLGGEAGRSVKLADALINLAIEMLAHRSDLQALSSDQRLSGQERDSYHLQVVDLERFATALNSVALQVDRERWQPEHQAGLLELAKQNSVTLPDWMTSSSKPKKHPGKKYGAYDPKTE